jgi:hypothetical protein
VGITAFPFTAVIDVPTARILGRDDAGTGAAEALTNTEIFAILGTGTPSASTYLRGDGTWASVSAGVGGSTGSVDNAVLRADGAGGATLQASSIVITDNFTASPNATVNHASIQATGDTTNVSVSVVPKGSGAFSLHVPDGTTTGGNARGANAIDLQTSRTAANQVASGTGSAIVGGQGQRASNTNSGCFAGANTVTGDHSGALAGSNTVSGNFAGSVGGQAGAISGARAGSVGGIYPTPSGTNSAVLGGDFGRPTGENAVTLGGRECQSDAANSISHGDRAVARLHAMRATSGGRFAAAGDAQAIECVLRNKTITNSAVTLFLDGASIRLTIPSGKILHATVHILGSKSDGTAVANYMRQVGIKNVGGTTSLVGTVNTIGTDEAAGTSIAITADDTNDALQINVTGVTSETWRWVAVVYGVELAYGN